MREIIDPLKDEVRRHDLWATHLGPELGGKGHGQLKLSLLNEVLGQSQWAPIIFGYQAPDTGNAEIVAHYGAPRAEGALPQAAARRRDLLVLLDDRAARRRPDDVQHACRQGWRRVGDQRLEILLLECEDRGVPHRHGGHEPRGQSLQGLSMFLVPTDTPEINIMRNVGLGGEPADEGSPQLIHYEDVRVPDSALLGGEGQAFAIAQTRLGGGRIHPFDAHDRAREERLRHDVRAGAQPRDAGQPPR